MRRILSVLFSVLIMMMVFAEPVYVNAYKITFEDFLKKLIENNGYFDGNGVTVEWSPNLQEVVYQRIQSGKVQYQIFRSDAHRDAKDINIHVEDTNFVYIPANITIPFEGPWNQEPRTWKAEELPNAELQFLNGGDVEFISCEFTQVVISPYGHAEPQKPWGGDGERKLTIDNCKFNDIYDTYALKDIYTGSAVITNNEFNDCSGAIYFEGSATRKNITITGNKFNRIDQNAPELKKNTRGVVQLSKAVVFDDDTVFVLKDNVISGNTVKNSATDGDNGLPVIRLISQSDVTISGWTAGEAFSVKAEGDAVKLPHFAEEEMTVNGHKYTFKGWAAAGDYQGPTVVVDALLKSGTERTDKGMYYAVWQDEVVDEPDDDPIVPVRPSRPDDKEESCEERFGDDWHWSEEYGACVLKEYSIVIVDTSTK